MTITKTDITTAEGVGVFTRGYQDQMKEAAEREDEALTTFRSRKPWRSAEKALQWRDDDVVVYYCPRGKERIHYTAVLEDMLLHPDPDEDPVEEFLKTQLDIHRQAEDELWEQYGGADTLYRVSQFTPVEEPYPFTELRKISDGKSLDPDYGYSYSVVQQR